MSRVMAEGFDALFAAGLRDILGADGVEVCDPGDDGVTARLGRCLPDLVLLNSALASTPSAVDELLRRHPGVTVITCSANDSVMQVYPPFHGGESYQAPLEPAEICRHIDD
jgi:hypothetical protein